MLPPYVFIPSKNRGEQAKTRPDGTCFKGEYRGDVGGNTAPNPPTQSFQSFCFNSEAKPEPDGAKDWLIDSGCNRYMTPFKEGLDDLKNSEIVCTFGNTSSLKAESSGSTSIVVEDESKSNNVKIILSDILYVPGLPQRMLSTGQLRRAGGEYVESGSRGSVLIMPDQHTGIPLTQKGDFLWLTESGRQHSSSAEHTLTLTTKDMARSSTAYAPGGRETASASLIDWHEALGHPHPACVMFLEQRGLIKITGEKTLDDFNCRICKEAKSTLPHYQRGTRSIKRPGEVVHVDLVGPFEPDMEGYTYLMTFINEATRFKSVFGLKTRDQAYKHLKTYQEGMRLIGVIVECIRGDGAGEFGRSRVFRQELINLALKWESSPPYTHQQQGLIERAIRQVVEGGRAQLSRAGLSETNIGSMRVKTSRSRAIACHTPITRGGLTP